MEENHIKVNVDNLTPKNNPKYKNLVLSGGSVRGIAHLGAIKKLVDENLIDLNNIESIAGSSVGALIGILLALQFTIDQIWDFVLSIDMKKIAGVDLLMLFSDCGVNTGNIIRDILEEILTKTTNIKNITFKQLFEITKISITIVGSCLTTKEVVYFNHINTPDFIVSTAVRISISMPGYFTPVIIDGKKYIDGSILNNYPMNLYESNLDRTIGIIICGDYDTDYKYPEEYFMAVINLFLHNYYNIMKDKYKDNTICINKIKNLSIFNFDIDSETKKELYRCGFEATEEFIERIKGIRKNYLN